MERGRKEWEDLLPEQTRYRDDGCHIHPHCLTCPLSRCIYDEPDSGRGVTKALRNAEILSLRTQGVGLEELAQRFGVSKRTIHRALGRRPEPVEGRNGR